METLEELINRVKADPKSVNELLGLHCKVHRIEMTVDDGGRYRKLTYDSINDCWELLL